MRYIMIYKTADDAVSDENRKKVGDALDALAALAASRRNCQSSV